MVLKTRGCETTEITAMSRFTAHGWQWWMNVVVEVVAAMIDNIATMLWHLSVDIGASVHVRKRNGEVFLPHITWLRQKLSQIAKIWCGCTEESRILWQCTQKVQIIANRKSRGDSPVTNVCTHPSQFDSRIVYLFYNSWKSCTEGQNPNQIESLPFFGVPRKKVSHLFGVCLTLLLYW